MDKLRSSKPPSFNAFISYSHGASAAIAQALQTWLQRFAKPWWKRRVISVFRDETDLSASPALWSNIEVSLRASEWLIFIATPEAAQSKWVKRELRFWLGDDTPLQRSPEELDRPMVTPSREKADRLLIVLADGDAHWRDGEPGNFVWPQSTALPICLSGVFEQEPLWLDLRNLTKESKPTGQIGASNPRFMDAIARLSVPIRGVDLSTLISEDARQHRKVKRLAASAAGGLTALTFAATVSALIAILAASAADKQRRIAEAERVVAQAQSLDAVSATNLPRAAGLVASAYRTMRLEADKYISPSWLLNVLKLTGLVNLQLFKTIVEADSFTSDADQTSASFALMHKADNLLPLKQAEGAYRTPSAPGPLYFVDSTHAVAKTAGNQISVFDPHNGRELATFDTGTLSYLENGQAIQAFSDDGRRYAALNKDGMLRIFSTLDGKQIFSLDPRQLYAENQLIPAPLSSLDSADSQVTETFQANQQTAKPNLVKVALDKTGRQLLTISSSGVVKSFDLDNRLAQLGRPWTLQIPAGETIDRIGRLVLDDTGELLAFTTTVYPSGQAPVYVFGALDGRPHAALNGLGQPIMVHAAGVNAIAIHSGHNTLAAGSDDGVITMWSISTGARERTIAAESAVRSLAFGPGSANEYLLAGTAGGIASVYQVGSGREVARASHPGYVDAVAWDKSGRYFATGSGQIDRDRLMRQRCEASAEATDDEEQLDCAVPIGKLRFWEFDVNEFRSTPFDSLSTIAADGELVAAVSHRYGLAVWNTRTKNQISTENAPSVPRWPFALDAQRNVITAAEFEGGIAKVYDLKKQTVALVPGANVDFQSVANVAFDSSGKILARLLKVGDQDTPDCRIEIFELPEGRLIGEPPCSVANDQMALSPDGTRLAIASMGLVGRIEIWDVVGKKRGPEDGMISSLSTTVGQHIVFSRDGNSLAVAGDRDVTVRQTSDLTPLGVEIEFPASVLDVALSDDGKFLAASLLNRSLVIYDTRSGVLYRSFSFDTDSLGGGGLTFYDKGLFASFGNSNPVFRNLWHFHIDADMVANHLEDKIKVLPEHDP